MNKIENIDNLRGCFEKLQGRAQESRKREGKKEMFVEVKLELYFLHAPPQHRRDTETNLMTI
jgi:hypothetical protein